MPATKTVTLYTFEELSKPAQEIARQWWRDSENELCGFADSAIEDAARVAEILGVSFKQNPYRTVGENTRHSPAVYWCLDVQGSGASFEGTYKHAKGCAAKIRAYAPQDAALRGIADTLESVQRHHAYKLTASMTIRGSYTHSGCMAVEVDGIISGESTDDQIIAAELRAFADWIYKQIGDARDYAYSDEAVDENIIANEYTFLASGKRED